MFSLNAKPKPKDAAIMNAQDSDIVIPIIGAAGVGKSFLDAIGHPSRATVGDTLTSCTTRLEPFVIEGNGGRRVVLVDTPGLDDTMASDTNILKGVADLVIPGMVARTQLWGEWYKFSKQCNAASLDKVVLVTSKWARDSGGLDLEGREEELKSDHWGGMINRANGARVMRLRAGEEELCAFEILDSIIKRVDADAERKAVREVDRRGQIRQMIPKFLSNAKAKTHRHDRKQVTPTGEAAWVSQADVFNRDGTDQDERFRDVEEKLREIENQLRNLRTPFYRRLQRWLIRV